MIKPSSSAIKKFFEARASLGKQRVIHEMGVRGPFQYLLAETARAHGWTLIAEDSLPSVHGGAGGGQKRRNIRPDGTLKDEYGIRRGYWESKDEQDDLDQEIEAKIRKGYPLDNIIFEDSRNAVLYQDRGRVMSADLKRADDIAKLLTQFFKHIPPDIEDFKQAIEEFKKTVPDLAARLAHIVAKSYDKNKAYKSAFDDFFHLCQTSLNPNIAKAAVEEMLVQHLLTERLIRTIFNNPEFTRRNVIAVEVEKVIAALTGSSFSREEFLKSLDRFYGAIENAARTITDFTEKQHFLNTVYERFFQGYSVKLADTHGIVYTPQPIVDFMCASVEEVLKEEFGKTLGSKDVYIIDPCTGTGNFIVNLLNRVPVRDLPRVYREQLFANEIMLLPYYIATLNIEHAYYEKTGSYEPFEGLCFVDSLDLTRIGEKGTYEMPLGLSERNSVRVARQQRSPITVVIGNPPYNANQQNENDNNKNRKYKLLDKRVAATYAADSTASNKNMLSDPYVKFFRWAADRLGNADGLVCFVTNNSFVDQIAFDGMRKHMLQDFAAIYHVDLHGNVRKNPKLSGTTHNVFGIQVGVGITIAVRRTEDKDRKVFYHRVPEFWRKEEKLDWLDGAKTVSGTEWKRLVPDRHANWLPVEHAHEFDDMISLGSKEAKSEKRTDTQTLFTLYSRGVATCRDDVTYDFSIDALVHRVEKFIEDYNAEVSRYSRITDKPAVDSFVHYDRVKWSEGLKLHLQRGDYAEFNPLSVRISMYRPFEKQHLYYDRLLIERVYRYPRVLPTEKTESENQVVCVSGVGSMKPFHALITNIIPCLDLLEKTQCFPFYVYNEDGSGRRENVTDWALAQFRERYGGKGLQPLGGTSKDKNKGLKPLARDISKWDIFYYVYGILHHPGYREKFADNLKRELPRIPYAPDFWAFADAGKRLAELHLDYEKIEVPDESRKQKAENRKKGGKSSSVSMLIENPDVRVSYHVEKMRLSKDKTQLVINESLTLAGIPAEVFEYRLGNRSALEWVIDQYQVKTDKRSGIVSDPNREDDQEYTVRLVQQVIAVSLETVKIVKGLPEDFGA